MGAKAALAPRPYAAPPVARRMVPAKAPPPVAAPGRPAYLPQAPGSTAAAPTGPSAYADQSAYRALLTGQSTPSGPAPDYAAVLAATRADAARQAAAKPPEPPKAEPDKKDADGKAKPGADAAKDPKAPTKDGKDGAPAEADKGAAPKGKAKPGAPATADEQVPEQVLLPGIDANVPSLAQSRVQSPDVGEAFRPAALPPFRAAAKAKPGPPNPDQAQAVALFRRTMAESARLHASFIAIARHSAASVQATQSSLGALAQGDLDRGLMTLRGGLDQARLELDRRADSADAFIEMRRMQTWLGINAAANSALGALNALKADADATFAGHQAARLLTGIDGIKATASVIGAGGSAASAVSALDTKDYPTSGEAMDAAINEAIGLRLPDRRELRAKTYTEEMTAQAGHLSKIFAGMNTALGKQFTDIGAAMTETAKSSAASIVRSRDAARKQLAKGVRGMHRSVDQARQRGHAALVGQHNSLRREMIASHRDRAARDDMQAQQRAARGTSAALQAAKGQQAGADGLDEALAKEAARPPEDLAKVVQASAGGMLRQMARAGPEQRDRLNRSVRSGEDDARAQSGALGARLARSADGSGEQLNAASRETGQGIEDQAQRGAEPLGDIPPQVTAALASAYPATQAGYLALNEGSAEKPGAAQFILQAQKMIVDTLLGVGGGKGEGQGEGQGGGAAPAAATDAKGPKEKPAEFRDRAAIIARKPKTERGIDHLLVTAEKEIPSQIDSKAGSLYDSLMATSTNVEAVMAQLRGLTTLQGVALSQVYAAEKGGRDLAGDLQSELWKTFSTDYTNRLNVNAALNYLAGNVVEAANLELKAAVHLWNDSGRAERVQRAMTPAQLDKLNQAHPDTMKDVSGDLDEGEKVIFDLLNKIKPLEGLSEKDQADQREANYEAIATANAHALKRDIDQALKTRGEAGGDKAADAVATAFQSAGGDTLSGGDGALDDPEAAAARREAIWSRTDAKFAQAAPVLPNGMPNLGVGENANLGSIARYAAATRTYVKMVPNEGPHGGFRYETVQQGLSAKQAQLIDDIAKTGPESEETAASTIEFEMSRSEGKPREDRLRKALLGEDLMAAREGESEEKRAERLSGKDRFGNVTKGDEERARERKANVLKKVAERRAKAQETKPGQTVAPQSNEQVQQQIVAQLDARFAGDPSGAAYTKSMIENDTFAPDPVKAFDFALAHDERNKETLKATTERMTRKEIVAAVDKWDKKHPGKSLYSELGLYGKKGKLEGDARNEVEIGFRGKPSNDKEKALIAIMVVEQQERDSAAAGRAMARADFDRATKKRADILETIGITRDQIDEKGDIKLDVDGNEFRGNFNAEGQLELTPQKRRDFESSMRFAHMNAESYKQAVDRISQGIVMALVVAAAIITTFVTFGGAAAIWGPILITAAAGLAGMYATSKIRGDRYTSAEMQRDFVMTLVQAATAGLGAWLGGAGKAAGATAKGVATAEKGIETAAKTAATGEKIVAGAAGMAGKQGMSMGAKALQFGKDVVIGGTTNSINSFAAAAMDPENRRQGTALSKGVDGGVKGFLSGSLGAAVTKPLGALGRGAGNRFSPSLGKAGERIVGNVGSGYVSRLADSRIGQAMGDPHQSWAESIEGAKEGIGQDLIQAVGEHHAEGAAGRRAARKTSRAATNRPAAEPAATPHPIAREPANDNVGPAAHPDGDPGRVTVPAPHADADFDARRSPLTEEPGSLRPRSDGDEPLLRMRTAAGDDDAHMRSWDDKTNPDIRIVHPTFPDGVDLQPGMLGRLPDILPDTVIRGTDKTDPKQARQNYELMREHTLGREVLLAHNPKTGEYIVIQGLPHSVAAPPEGFVTLRHSHPELNTTDFHAHFATALPSGVGGDFSVLMQEIKHMAIGREGEVITHTSAIDIQINGQRSETTFSITKQGDNYTLSVTLNPPLHGTAKMGPFTDIRQYAQHASTLAGGGTDFGLSRPDNAPAAYTERGRAGPGEPSRVVRGATLAESERHDAAFVAAKMGVTDAASEKTRKNPVVGAAVEGAPPVAAPTMHEAHDRVRQMGLVGHEDSLAKLTRLLNSNDASFTPAMRSALAQAVLEATRFDMIQKGTLKPGDDVVMLFRGARKDRIDNYPEKGIDLSMAEKGSNHDAGQGLYGSQDYESALRYTGSATPGGDGAVLPLIVRRSELGNVIDVRTGTPLGDRWLAFIRQSKGKGVLRGAHEHLKGVLYPGVDHPIALELDGRGDRYDAFLKSLADDASLPEALRNAARNPDITIMDLGGVASVGNDRTMLTDQWAMHGQRIADLFNEAHGFPKPGREGPAAMLEPGGRMRTAAAPDPDAPAKAGPDAPQEAETPPAAVPEPQTGHPAPIEGKPPATTATAAPAPAQAAAGQRPPRSPKPGEPPRPAGLAEQIGALQRRGVDFSGEKNRLAIGRRIAAVVELLPEDHPMRGALADIAKQLQSGRKGPPGRDPWRRLAHLIDDGEHGAMIARELDRPAPGSREDAAARRGALRREWSVKRARGEETARGVELREAHEKALGKVAPAREAPSTSRRLREVEATPEYSVLSTDAPILGKNATGAIDPATGQRVAEAMRGLHNFDEERNFCLAQLRVGDESQLLMAKSNKQPLPGMTTLPELRLFTPNPNAARPNDHHTESVLLERTAQIIDAGRFARNSDFAVSMYTEREPCGSCRQIIRQFADRYPHIAARSVVSWSEDGGGQATFLEIAQRAAQEAP